jgi:Mg-chelatase subunit ChlD
MNTYRRRGGGANVAIFIIILIAVVFARRQENNQRTPPRNRVSTPVENPIENVLRPTAKQYSDGIAAAILIDTSGSMMDPVRDTDGVLRPKIQIARRAAEDLVSQFDKYSRDHAGQQIKVGIYEFSDRGRGPVCREVVPLGTPDLNAAKTAIAQMRAEGDTPIGDAMIVAKRNLDNLGLSKRHILVITDGENTKGYSPAEVTRVITNQSETDRASIYFVAFDVAASKFKTVRDSGGLVLAASNETDLQGTLNYLLTGKILAEQPEH